VAIKHALLGLLAEGPKHGYELKTAFDETIGERWSLNIGQVYNTLNRLARDGYVVLQEEVEQESRPDKKVYAITEAGREELFRWLAEPVEKPRRLKDEFTSNWFYARNWATATCTALSGISAGPICSSCACSARPRARSTPRRTPSPRFWLRGAFSM